MATILIVEDDIDTNEAICEYLQEAGHTTIPALDGDEVWNIDYVIYVIFKAVHNHLKKNGHLRHRKVILECFKLEILPKERK